MKRTRGERRASAEKLSKKRLREYKAGIVFGCGKDIEKKARRLSKTKLKFTGQSGSLKKDRRLAWRAARKAARQAIRAGKETETQYKQSVRWNYW